MKRFFLIGGLLLSLALPMLASDDSGTTIRRFAIFVGANNGGAKRELLQYAVRDAESTAHVFRDMGGIKSADSILLVDPSVSELNSQFNNIMNRIVNSKVKYSRTEFVFYYSGHSDDEGILLGKEKYRYTDLKATIEKLPADMKIVILDSCASGALTKVKGGLKTQPFLMDSSITMKGYAIMTSSSADEVSQESDSIKGSFFTYALLSGLRGAADTKGDGKVTLNEAYQYAYQETLAKTEKTIGGAQHPNYDIRMKGSGEVVLTDLRETSASLRFAKDLVGKIFVREESELLVTEITKTDGRTIEIGLAPGAYKITVEYNKQVLQAYVFLNDGDRLELTKQMLKPVKTEQTVKRGGDIETTNEAQTNATAENGSNSTAAVTNKTELTDEQALDDLIKRTRSNAQVLRENRARSNETAVLSNTNATAVGNDTNGINISFVINDTTNYIYIPVNVSFVPSLSINSMVTRSLKETEKIVNKLKFNFVVGYCDRLEGLSIGFVNLVGEDSRAFDSSLVTTTGRDFKGFQASFFSSVGRDFNGFQSGFVNLVGGDFSGFQAGFFNRTGGNCTSMQSGFVNINGGDVLSFQSGFYNHSGGSFRGFQSGFVNYTANDFGGFQTGFVNITGKKFGGFQTGFVNLNGGPSSGFQLGFVNIDEKMDGIPIGFVSIVKKDGQFHIQGTMDETGFYHAAILTGSKYAYNIYQVGADIDFSRWSCGVGLGFSMPVGILTFNLEGISSAVLNKGNLSMVNTVHQARAYASLNLWFVTVLAGVSFNYGRIYNVPLLMNVNGMTATAPSAAYADNPGAVMPVTGYLFPFGDRENVFWPGFFVGIQF